MGPDFHRRFVFDIPVPKDSRRWWWPLRSNEAGEDGYCRLKSRVDCGASPLWRESFAGRLIETDFD
jgi:hypothetical protein